MSNRLDLIIGAYLDKPELYKKTEKLFALEDVNRALLIAISRGHYNVVCDMISLGADVNYDNGAPLFLAGDMPGIYRLLERHGAFLKAAKYTMPYEEILTRDPTRALCYYIIHERTEEALAVLLLRPIINRTIALQVAVLMGNMRVIEVLCNADVTVDAIPSCSSNIKAYLRLRFGDLKEGYPDLSNIFREQEFCIKIGYLRLPNHDDRYNAAITAAKYDFRRMFAKVCTPIFPEIAQVVLTYDRPEMMSMVRETLEKDSNLLFAALMNGALKITRKLLAEKDFHDIPYIPSIVGTFPVDDIIAIRDKTGRELSPQLLGVMKSCGSDLGAVGVASAFVKMVDPPSRYENKKYGHRIVDGYFTMSTFGEMVKKDEDGDEDFNVAL